jgi:hypothetical protein
MKAVKLTLWQVRYTNKAYWRNPAAAFFTFAFPRRFQGVRATLRSVGNASLP